MKRIIPIISVILLTLIIICSCGEKQGEFVAVDKDNLGSVAWISEGGNAIEAEQKEKIVDEYNVLTPDGPVSDNLFDKVEWRILITVTPDNSEPTLFKISYIGDFRFIVETEGAVKSSYTVCGEDFYNAVIETKAQ